MHMNKVNPAYIVLIPSLNPDTHLVELTNLLLTNQLLHIIIVDDGSAPSYQSLFSALEDKNITVLHHPVNRGKGAALKTGFAYILEHYPHVLGVVTADADGQHTPVDIQTLGNALVKYNDSLILGVRDFSQPQVPFKSRWGNRITAFIFLYITRKECADTQTGLRAIPRKLIAKSTLVEGDRFEYEMNMLVEFVKQDIPLVQLPISTVYRDNNSHSHFRAFRDSWRIYKQLFRITLRFASSALLATSLDLILFTLLLNFVWPDAVYGIGLATLTARLSSGLVNFIVNAKWTFSYIGRKRDVAWKYGLLFVTLIVISTLLVTASSLIGVPPTLAKVIIDSSLFIVAYRVQKNYVFIGKKIAKNHH